MVKPQSSLERKIVTELIELGFPCYWNYGYNWEIEEWCEPSVEEIIDALGKPVSMARWSDGSGYSAFDADFGEEYPHRADGATLKEALVRLWLLKNRPIDEAFHHI